MASARIGKVLVQKAVRGAMFESKLLNGSMWALRTNNLNWREADERWAMAVGPVGLKPVCPFVYLMSMRLATNCNPVIYLASSVAPNLRLTRHLLGTSAAQVGARVVSKAYPGEKVRLCFMCLGLHLRQL